jgi:hypothetical protein
MQDEKEFFQICTNSVLWTFIFRMTASEDEENMLKKDTFHWEDHC